MARPTARRRSAGASSRSRSSRGSSSSSSQQAMLIGALGVLVLVLVVVFATNSGGARAGGGDGTTESRTPKPEARSQPQVDVPSSGKAGKTPDRPAPPLTAETLARLDELHREAVQHYNDSVRARTAGDNSTAREAAGRAKEVLDQWQALVEPNLRWQEYADLEDWAQPAEYMALEQRFQKYSELNNKVRRAGG